MIVPFLDLKQNYDSVKNEITTAISSVLDSCGYILGPHVQAFERSFADAHNTKHCIAVNTGTAGNHVALWALGVGAGDEVIMPANTFVATAWGATLQGAQPVFVDCDAQSYNLDPNQLERSITSKTKAVVAVHLYGQPADLDAIRQICDRKGVVLLEDAAQSHLAQYKGSPIGGLSRISSFSFYPGKNLGAYGEAGAVMTNDDSLAAKARMIRDHGASMKYHHQILGHNYRMEGLQGAVLGVKLKYLSKWTEARRAVAAKYGEGLAGVGDLTLPAELPYARHVYHLYVVQTAHRDGLQKFLGEQGVATGLHYPVPLHLQECFKNLNYSKGSFPVAERTAALGLSLPIFPEMTDEQIGYVVDRVKEFYRTMV